MEGAYGFRGAPENYRQIQDRALYNSTHRAPKGFKNQPSFSIKKATSGFPEVAFGFS